MSNPEQPVGQGRKRPQLNVDIDRLHLDVLNPRLPEEIQGSKESSVLEHLLHFDLDELADSMGQNGYFDEEPLVVVPDDLPVKLTPQPGVPETAGFIEFINRGTTTFTVLEGNRRLSTAKLLLDAGLRSALKLRGWTDPSEAVKKDLSVLPAIVYPTRKEVLPHLGVRHISGNKKWESYTRARYIAEMQKEGFSVGDIQKHVGDRAGVVRLNAICYNLLRSAREDLGLDIKAAKADFSLLQLAIGQAAVKRFLGWEKPDPKRPDQQRTLRTNEVDLDEPVQESHLQNLRDLLSLIYGDGSGNAKVITESRDVAKKLCLVLGCPVATANLIKHRQLDRAMDLLSDGEAKLKCALVKAKLHLEKAMRIAGAAKSAETFEASAQCLEAATRVWHSQHRCDAESCSKTLPSILKPRVAQ